MISCFSSSCYSHVERVLKMNMLSFVNLSSGLFFEGYYTNSANALPEKKSCSLLIQWVPFLEELWQKLMIKSSSVL